tara:strand:+ start:1392 stop:2699 length:1308 start_codon:yes stop_codon:yes gene_type:complete
MTQKKINRRSFVKKTTIGAGALLTVPYSVDAMVNVGNVKKLKLCVVGCGGRGTGAAVQALRADKDVELVAMADAFQDTLDNSLKSIKEELDGEIKVNVKQKNKFVGFDAFKKAIDISDVVILASPPGFRPLHFEYAINNDKHVFMEKPVAVDAFGVRRVLNSAKLATQKKLNVVVGLQRRYQKNYLALMDRVRKNDIGKIISGQVYWNSPGVWVRKRRNGQSEMEYQMRNWYYFNWLCGDHILEQHIHNIDVANWILNEYPVSANGMGGREVRKGLDHGQIFDHHYVEFNYSSGAVISSQCRHQPGTNRNVSERFQGTNGSVSFKKNKIIDLNGNEIYSYKQKGDKSPYQIEHDKLFKSIRDGNIINDGEYGAKSTLTAIMGRMATYTGQEIKWNQIMESDQNLVPDNLDWSSTPPVIPNSEGKYPIPIPGVTDI